MTVGPLVGGADPARDRLVTCAAFTVPAVLLARLPAVHYPYWQWTVLVLAAPVVGRGAWPLHRAAVTAARRAGVVPATLVSAGAVVAYAWSLVATVTARPDTPVPSLADAAAAVVVLWLLVAPHLEPVEDAPDRGVELRCAATLGLAAATAGFWGGGGAEGAQVVGTAVAVLFAAAPALAAHARATTGQAARDRTAEYGVPLDGPALATAARVDTVVLALRGTLTGGSPAVSRVTVTDGTDVAEVLAVAAALAAHADGPVAAAIVEHAREHVRFWPAVSDVTAAGTGLAGTTGARSVTVEVAAGEEDDGDDLWAVTVSWDGAAQAVIDLADPVRPGAAEAVAELHRLGVTPILLTGSPAAAAGAVAAATDVDTVLADAVPAGRDAVLARLRDDGHAVAVAGSDLDGSPAADVLDLGADPTAAAAVLRVARRRRATVEACLAWAIAYPVVALPLAAAGLLPPLLAGACGPLATALVVATAARLRRA